MAAPEAKTARDMNGVWFMVCSISIRRISFYLISSKLRAAYPWFPFGGNVAVTILKKREKDIFMCNSLHC